MGYIKLIPQYIEDIQISGMNMAFFHQVKRKIYISQAMDEIRGLFKYECKWLHNFLNISATTKCHTFLVKNYLSPLKWHQT